MQRPVSLHRTILSEWNAVPTETPPQSRDCFNGFAGLGWDQREGNGVTSAVHKVTYGERRARHPPLPSGLVTSPRRKATEALKSAFALDRKGEKVGAPDMEWGGIQNNVRSYRMAVGHGVVRWSTAAGRVTVPGPERPRFRVWRYGVPAPDR